MTAVRTLLVTALLVLAGVAQAQVYRCGDGRTYTDKPCTGAAAVDLRTNVMNAGPRKAPVDVPAPAVIPPGADRPLPVPDGRPSDVWQRSDGRQQEQRGRTNGY